MTFRIIVLLLGYIFLYAPVLFLVVFSFNDSQYPGLWKGFTLHWYERLYENYPMFLAALTSLRIAALSATLSTLLATLAAIIYVRYEPFRTRKLMGNSFLIPLGTPEVVTGFSLVLVLGILEKITGWPHQFGSLTITIAHTTIALGYSYSMIEMRLREFDMSLSEAALDLGASPLQAFLRVTLPIIKPAILSAWLLAFALSVDDVVLASFLSGPGATTLPLLLLSQIRTGITPEINALATIIVLSVSLMMLISIKFTSLPRK